MPKLIGLLVFALGFFISYHSIAVDLIWTDSMTGQILRGAAIGGSQPAILFDKSDYPATPTKVAPFGLAMDGEYIYWGDVTTGQILRGSADGVGPATVLFDISDYPNSPSTIGLSGLTIDSDFVYWADNANGEILRGAKDGSGTAAVVFDIADYPEAPNDIYPWDVTYNNGSIYWSDSDTAQILRGSGDGSGSVDLIFGSDPDLTNLGLAVDENYVYWADVDNVTLTGSIMRGMASGSGDPVILYDVSDYPSAPSSNVPISMAIDDEQLFWIDNFTHQILRGSTDGTEIPSVVFDIGNYPGSPTIIGPTFLVVVPDDYTADYDGDGDIDGRDFLVWQRGDSPDPSSSADLILWQDQYGTSPLISNIVSVPEPASFQLLFLALGVSWPRLRTARFCRQSFVANEP